jgi:lipopolysaccharide transport system ATP-binding protein
MSGSDEIAIRIEGLSKQYTIIPASVKGIKKQGFELFALFTESFQYFFKSLRAPRENEILWALKDISLEIKQGEVVGIIGQNGAGKSTLLKILSRITEPSAGRVEIYGRASSLLEVGTGFHPDLTGRENIYVNGMMLGMSRVEIDRKFDDIVTYAGVEKFIDNPVKYYSSGMYVRLGFSVAAHLAPEIMIVDEVLAVGDLEFQSKSIGTMGSLSKSGRTVIYVSHNLASINRLCDRVILLADGHLVADGSPRDTIQKYLELQKRGANTEGSTEATFFEETELPMQVDKVRLLNSEDKLFSSDQLINTSETLKVQIEYTVREPIASAYVMCTIKNQEEIIVLWTYDGDSSLFGNRKRGKFQAEFKIQPYMFPRGRYTINCAVIDLNKQVVHFPGDAFSFLIEDTDSLLAHRNINWPGLVRLNPDWVTRKV